MAKVLPFQAIRYNAKLIHGTLADVVSPPYDAISLEEQHRLYERHPQNVVRLILNREYDGDSPTDNRYTRAAHSFDEWQKSGLLIQDLNPCYYIYEQTFMIPGASDEQTFTRRGVMAALKLEPIGTGCVFPHEETFPSHKKDQLNLMRACRANLSPVFGLIPDFEKNLLNLLANATQGKAAACEVREEDGTLNRLWVIEDERLCTKISDVFTDRKVFIADGLHRYETACLYKEERWNNDSSPGVRRQRSYDYVLMMCVPMSDPGLRVLPTHRLICKTPDFSREKFLGQLTELFEIQEASDAELLSLTQSIEGPVRFGLVFNNRSKHILTAKSAVETAINQVAGEKSKAWRDLDVAILHQLIIKDILGISSSSGSGRNGVAYGMDARGVIDSVPGSASYDAGFLLRPTQVSQVCAVAESGERMPQKSTCFYPRLLSGLVTRKL